MVMYRAILLFLIILLDQGSLVLAQKQPPGKKEIVCFLIELSEMDSIPNFFVHKYIAVNEGRESMDKVKKGLKEIKIKYLTYKGDSDIKDSVQSFNIGSLPSDYTYYTLQLDKGHSMNFVVGPDKILSISLYTAADYSTLVFF